jgi:sugar phosphate isomerase/epimerase
MVAYRGFDPVDYPHRLEKDDRLTHFHMKDWSGQQPGPGQSRLDVTRDVGQGVIDFQRFFRAIQKPEKYWYIVEREASPDPTQTAQNSYNYLANLTGQGQHGPMWEAKPNTPPTSI